MPGRLTPRARSDIVVPVERPESEKVEEAAGALRRAARVVVLTGAGISAESGVPTFRDAQTGLWARFRPEDLATPEAFERDPKLVWEWYAWRRQLVANARPNPGHLAIAQLEKQVAGFTLITQNVDGLHHRAGSVNVLELHGNIARTKCYREDTIVDSWADAGDVPPRCRRCGGPLRPDVVWFGEALPSAVLAEAVRASESAQVFLSVGTSTVVEPAASLPFRAIQRGATVIEINPTDTPLTPHAGIHLPGPAGEILPRLVQAAHSPETAP